MAWTTPEDWTPGPPPGGKMNAQLKENLGMLWHEVAYVEFVSAVNASTGGTQVVSAGAITFLPYPIEIQFFSPRVDAGVTLRLYDGNTELGSLYGRQGSFWGRRKFTPPAGTHTYRIVAKGSSGQVKADVGGNGKLYPGFIRILQKGLA
jgi:hypothetical protein